MHANPYEAYRSVDKASLTGRELEAEILTQAALKLKECQDNWDASDRNERLDAALKYNQLLWSIFQGELSREDTTLPIEVKVNLIRLSAFVDKQIFEIMAYPEREKLDIVISINRNIALGLKGSPGTGMVQ